MRVTFHGVRGSCPCPGEATRRYGGNTSCVVIEAGGADPLVLDLGTGLRSFAEGQPHDGSFRATALVTHLHWDHVQGLPFFPPVDRPGARLDVYGPAQEGAKLQEVFGDLMRPPYFPVRAEDLRGEIVFHDLSGDDFLVGDALVKARLVPHIGDTLGFRVEAEGRAVAYVSDHQQPPDPSLVAPEVLELCEGADLLIHDAQYTEAEFGEKAHWGHCTIDYALRVAALSGAQRLVLFHHDPGHNDSMIDLITRRARRVGDTLGVGEVVAAAEGLTVCLDGTV